MHAVAVAVCIAGSLAPFGHRPELIFVITHRLCHWNYRLRLRLIIIIIIVGVVVIPLIGGCHTDAMLSWMLSKLTVFIRKLPNGKLMG